MSYKGSKPHRYINGIWYTLRTVTNHWDAIQIAHKYRSEGRKAKVIKTQGGYGVFLAD